MENSTIQFTKMHGAGNDYIYVNTLLYKIKDPAKASIEWSKPHFGIGSDGLILIGEATEPDADFSMRIFNNDGSEAMMCGNGTRCVAKFLHDKGLTDKNPIRLQTLSGIKVLNLHLDSNNKVEAVTVDMGEPILKQPAQFGVHGGKATNWELTVDGHQFIGTFVSMGNPHFVIFLNDRYELDADPDSDKELFPSDTSRRYDPNASMGKRKRNNTRLWHRCLRNGGSSQTHRSPTKRKQHPDGWRYP